MAKKNGNAAEAKDEAAATTGNGADTSAGTADDKKAGAASTDQAQTEPPRLKTLSQFIRDMSFENVASSNEIKGDLQQEIQIGVNLDSKPRGENRYEVSIKLKMDSKNKGGGEKIFLLEMEYVGLFEIDNVPQQQLHPVLMIECPRIIFPYLRRIVGDITRDGGFAPLNLDQFDFMQFYRQEMQRRAAQNKDKDQEKPKELSGTA